jgi:hypothetical protein
MLCQIANRINILSEENIQKSIIRTTSMYPVLRELLFHIPNGGYRHPIEAKKLKLMGVKKGVSDLFLPSPNKEYPGLWLELKTEKGILSPEQENWLFKMRKNGYAAEVSRSVEESVDLLLSYLDSQYKPISILKYRI